MTACFSLVSTARSTPLTIWVPSSSATCRFLISSNATDLVLFSYCRVGASADGAASPRLVVSYPDRSHTRPRDDPLLSSPHALRNRHLGAPDPPARPAP